MFTCPPVHLYIPSFSCGSPVPTACFGFSFESSSEPFLHTNKSMREQARQNVKRNSSWIEMAQKYIFNIYFDTDFIGRSQVGDTWVESNQLNHDIIHYPNTEGKTSAAEKKVLLRWELPFITDFFHLSLYKSLFTPCWCLICLPAENIETWSNDTCRTWIDYYKWPCDLGLIQVCSAYLVERQLAGKTDSFLG